LAKTGNDRTTIGGSEEASTAMLKKKVEKDHKSRNQQKGEEVISRLLANRRGHRQRLNKLSHQEGGPVETVVPGVKPGDRLYKLGN